MTPSGASGVTVPSDWRPGTPLQGVLSPDVGRLRRATSPTAVTGLAVPSHITCRGCHDVFPLALDHRRRREGPRGLLARSRYPDVRSEIRNPGSLPRRGPLDGQYRQRSDSPRVSTESGRRESRWHEEDSVGPGTRQRDSVSREQVADEVERVVFEESDAGFVHADDDTGRWPGVARYGRQLPTRHRSRDVGAYGLTFLSL